MKQSIIFKILISCLYLVLGAFCCLKTYSITNGDSCWAISNKFGIDLDKFIRINPGLNCNNLQIGIIVCIGEGENSKTYIVKSGDNCWDISQSFGLTLNDLFSFNPSLNCQNLIIGQVIKISDSNYVIEEDKPDVIINDDDYDDNTQINISYDQFAEAVIACGYPTPSKNLYSSFISRAYKDGDITSNRELAMFLANILHESGGLIYNREIRCKNDGCPQEYRNSGDFSGVYYYGRGFIQLTWSYNYRDASFALFGDDRLVINPDLVAQSEDYSWAVSFWFWKAKVHNYVQGGEFGNSISKINGGLECNPCRGACSKRINNYSIILRIFGVFELPNVSGC